jgi:hypothetical protein
MKKLSVFAIVFFAVTALFLSGCSKDEETPTGLVEDPDPGGTVIAQGIFSGNRNYQVSGNVKLVEQGGTKVLRFENFSSSNGPDLKVYLAADPNASRFINMGELKSVSGNQNYVLPGMPELSQYPYALIWCEEFGVLFGSANLK